MAVPGPVTSGLSAGCHQLIRDGALLVTRPEEVLEAVGRLGEDLDGIHDELAARLDVRSEGGATDADDGEATHPAMLTLLHLEADALPARGVRDARWLGREAGVPPDAVRAALTELERRGFARSRDGLWQLVAGTGGS